MMRTLPSFIPSRRRAPRQAGGTGSSPASSSHHTQPESPTGIRASIAGRGVSGRRLRIGRGRRRGRGGGARRAGPALRTGGIRTQRKAGRIAGRGRRCAAGRAARPAGSRLRRSPRRSPRPGTPVGPRPAGSGRRAAGDGSARGTTSPGPVPARRGARRPATIPGRGTAPARDPGRSPAARPRSGRSAPRPPAAVGVQPFPQRGHGGIVGEPESRTGRAAPRPRPGRGRGRPPRSRPAPCPFPIGRIGRRDRDRPAFHRLRQSFDGADRPAGQVDEVLGRSRGPLGAGGDAGRGHQAGDAPQPSPPARRPGRSPRPRRRPGSTPPGWPARGRPSRSRRDHPQRSPRSPAPSPGRVRNRRGLAPRCGRPVVHGRPGGSRRHWPRPDPARAGG